MKICKECGQSVPEDATECPYCGAEITNGKRIANELVAMVRAGQINPMNVMRIRQAVESNLPQLVNYYQEQGNYGKVMYYQQKAIAFDQIFRALQM